MNRTQLTLAVLLIVQLLLIVLVRSPFSGAAGSVQPHALLPALEAVTPMRLQIVGSDERELTLEKRGDGWVVADLDGFPADGSKIEDLFDNLRGLKVRRPVVSGSRYHETFKVGDDDFEARLRLWDDSADDPRIDLILGTSPTYRAVHVRLAEENPVYEVQGLAAHDVRSDPGTWVDRQLVDVAAEHVVGVTVANDEGSFEIARRDGTWIVESPEEMQGLTLDDEKVSDLVEASRSIQIAEPVGAAAGDERETADATVALRVATEPEAATEIVSVRVGAKVEDNESQRYISRSDFDYLATVWESSVSDLLEAKVLDLMPTDLDSESTSVQTP
jgi:hypothetical protein